MVKILVPVDYSSCSVAALRKAIMFAKGAGGRLVLLHVVEPESDPARLLRAQELDAVPEEVSQLLGSLSTIDPPIDFEHKTVIGKTAACILEAVAAQKIDLIVMGTKGRTGVRRLLMGSVAEEVCRKAPCPVLTLKAGRDAFDGDQIDEFIDSFSNYPENGVTGFDDALTSDQINQSPVLAMVSRAIGARASDVHIDPLRSGHQIRFRVDGKLIHFCDMSPQVAHALMTQLKVAAEFDIADPFHSQEGRLVLPESLSHYEVRVTSVRTCSGEAISLRILNRLRLLRPMEDLGLSHEAQASIEEILRHGEGLVLVTGPTGSGKTTTLYSMLRALDDGSRNIVSIEDPVEYDMPTFRQIPVDLKHGITLTSGLRTLLRLDPDVVFVGEIRDREAAETAMRAASSGKYVFSSLHTRDVASTITAIRDLKVEDRSLAANLAGIVSQRLLRRLCTQCSRSAALSSPEQVIFSSNGLQPPAEIRHPVGCPHCRGTGYHDRVGIFEMVTSNLPFMLAIEEGASEEALRGLVDSHSNSMLKDALRKVAAGVTSLEEVATMTGLLPAIRTDRSAKPERDAGPVVTAAVQCSAVELTGAARG